MSKKYGIVLAALLAIGVAMVGDAAHAQSRAAAQPFLVGPEDMDTAADMVADSLRRKADGTAPVSEELCRKRQSCITPREMFEAITSKHPESGLVDLDKTDEYMRTLKKQQHPAAGKRRVARILESGGVRAIDWSMLREPIGDEVVWVDPNTGEEIFMGHCLNVIDLTPVVEELIVTPTPGCVEAIVPVNRNTAGARMAILVQADSPAIPEEDLKRCLAFKKPGETTFTYGWRNDCLWGQWAEADGVHITECSTVAPIAYLSTIGKDREVALQGGLMFFDRPGYLVVQLPPQMAIASYKHGFLVCLEERERIGGEEEIRHAIGQYAEADHYVKSNEGRKQAVYNPASFPAGVRHSRIKIQSAR